MSAFGIIGMVLGGYAAAKVWEYGSSFDCMRPGGDLAGGIIVFPIVYLSAVVSVGVGIAGGYVVGDAIERAI